MAKTVENYSKILNNLEANIAFFIFLQREISRRLVPVYSPEQCHNEAECARPFAHEFIKCSGDRYILRLIIDVEVCSKTPGHNYYKLCAIVAGEKKRNITELLPWRMSWIFNGGTFKMLLKWVEKSPIGVEKGNLEADGFRTCKSVPNFIRLNFFSVPVVFCKKITLRNVFL